MTDPGLSHTFAEMVDAALAGGVAGALMPTTGAAFLPPTLGRLDGAVTDFFGFEAHLGRAEATVDTLVCIKAATGGRERLAATLPRQGDAWREDLHAFMAAWMDPATPWAERVENIWLECDLVAPQLPQPAPSLFFGAYRLVGPDEPDLMRALLRASAMLRGGSLDPDCAALALRVLRLLPPGGAIFQIGQMMARPGAPLRLCLRDVPMAAATDYLAELGYPTRRAQLETLVRRLTGLGGSIDLDLDLGQGLGPRIGFEWCPPADGSARIAAEGELFAWLVGDGLCVPDKATACRTWTRLVHCRRHRELWPAPLFAGDGDPARQGTSCIGRFLNHVKLVAEPEGRLTAKAYLACLHRFVPDAEIKTMLRAADAAAAGLGPAHG